MAWIGSDHYNKLVLTVLWQNIYYIYREMLKYTAKCSMSYLWEAIVWTLFNQTLNSTWSGIVHGISKWYSKIIRSLFRCTWVDLRCLVVSYLLFCVLCFVDHCLSFWSFSFVHCIVCPPLTYEFLLPFLILGRLKAWEKK